ncbi:hypothetical protein HMPREF0973_02945 [Prevotella veroralis F0319]|uniref:Uncharacterized protein n=1 Tax=Prevotella veroralis F0319 TaxID=649761 RepID=C9MTG9_9BACT|nr:hypothetical protein HMPREF0973_02945 [Prevotella veroralis F0319]
MKSTYFLGKNRLFFPLMVGYFRLKRMQDLRKTLVINELHDCS